MKNELVGDIVCQGTLGKEDIEIIITRITDKRYRVYVDRVDMIYLYNKAIPYTHLLEAKYEIIRTFTNVLTSFLEYDITNEDKLDEHIDEHSGTIEDVDEMLDITYTPRLVFSIIRCVDTIDNVFDVDRVLSQLTKILYNSTKTPIIKRISLPSWVTHQPDTKEEFKWFMCGFLKLQDTTSHLYYYETEDNVVEVYELVDNHMEFRYVEDGPIDMYMGNKHMLDRIATYYHLVYTTFTYNTLSEGYDTITCKANSGTVPMHRCIETPTLYSRLTNAKNGLILLHKPDVCLKSMLDREYEYATGRHKEIVYETFKGLDYLVKPEELL